MKTTSSQVFKTILMIMIPVLLLAALVMAFVQYTKNVENSELQELESLETVAGSGSVFIDGNKIEAISGADAYENTEYISLQSSLQKMRD